MKIVKESEWLSWDVSTRSRYVENMARALSVKYNEDHKLYKLVCNFSKAIEDRHTLGNFETVIKEAQTSYQLFEACFGNAPKHTTLTTGLGIAVVLSLSIDHLSTEELEDAAYSCIIPRSMLIEWAMNGFPTFHLTEDVEASLLATNVHGLQINDLKIPFSSFVVRLAFPIKIAELNVREVLVTYHEDAVASSVKGGGFRIQAFGTTDDGRNDICSLGDVVLPNEDINSWVYRRTKTTGEHRHGLLTLWSLVVNVCMYVNTNPSSMKKTQGGKRSAVTGIRHPTVWDVRSLIPLDRAITVSIKAGGVSPDNKTSWHINKRFQVRGHYKRQACGEKRVERKIVWVKPYWKGEDREETITCLYSLGN
jgi:hypothetical protein